MANPMNNLKLLKEDMEKKDYLIYLFEFPFEKVNYLVYIKRLTPEVKKTRKELEYYSSLLIFKKVNNPSDTFTTFANTSSFKRSAKDIREYFNINYHTDFKLLFKTLYNAFGQSIPQSIEKAPTDSQKEDLARALYVNTDDEDKVYCKAIKHNALGKYRSQENAEKTKLLRSDLFEKYGDDPKISFIYSADPKENKSIHEIEIRYVRNNK